jgi:RimJ/RimL family protein N-acetyltransferase
VAVPPPTARLTFREMSPADQELMETLLGDPEVMWVYPRPYDSEAVRAWIDWNVGLYRDRGFGLWILTLRDTGEFVGECGLTPQQVEGTTEIEVGYQLLKRFWGRGLASEAAAASRDFARDVAGLDRLVALIDSRNTASQHVAANIGLRFERDVTFPTKTLGVYAADLRPAAAQ